MKREDLKSLIKSIIRESIDNEPETGVVKSPVRTSYHVDPYDLSRTSRDPDAEREYVYQVKKITSDVQGDNYKEVVVGEYDTREEAERVCYAANLSIGRVGKVPAGSPKLEVESTKSNNRYNGGVYLPQALRENNQETFVKEIDGTVGVSDIDYDYSAKVTVTVVSTREPHGEVTDEIMPISKDDIDIRKIVPEPNEALYAEVAKAIRYNIRENIPDFLNESDMEKQPDPIQSAKDWILDCANSSEEEADIKEWLEDASDDKVKKYVNRTFDGGWNGFLDTL